VLYYGYFLAFVPWYAHSVMGAEGIVGQLAHYVGRGAASRLNYAALCANLMALNGHYSPYLAWAFFLGAFAWLALRERRVLFWLAPFALVWSFYFTGNTQHYFVLVSICALPFAVSFLAAKLPPRAFVGAVVLLAVVFFAWNLTMFIRPYEALEYPDRVWQWGFATRGYPHNIVEPYRAVGKDLDRILGPDGKFVDDLDASFSTYYYNDQPDNYQHSRRAGTLGTVEFPLRGADDGELSLLDAAAGVRAVVTRRTLRGRGIGAMVSFAGSRIRIYVLSSDSSPSSGG